MESVVPRIQVKIFKFKYQHNLVVIWHTLNASLQSSSIMSIS